MERILLEAARRGRRAFGGGVGARQSEHRTQQRQRNGALLLEREAVERVEQRHEARHVAPEVGEQVGRDVVGERDPALLGRVLEHRALALVGERREVKHEAPAKTRAQIFAHGEPDRRGVAGGDEGARRMGAHLVEQIEQGDLLRAREFVAVVDGVNGHARIERERRQRALRPEERGAPGDGAMHERRQQMAAAAAGLAPDVEGAIGERTRRERAVELGEPRHEFGIGAGEEIVECRRRRRA